MRVYLPLFLLSITAFAQNGARSHQVKYQVVHGRAVVEGDIDVGPVEQVDARLSTSHSFNIAPQQFRWPNGVVPYVIDSDIPNPQRIMDAINIWNTTTPIHYTPRGNDANYVHFIRQQSNGVCFSSVGMVGGEQFIRVDDLCGANGLAHEIGHSIGLHHEQTRPDRDFYLSVNFSNMDKRYFSDSALLNARTASEGGPYDYGSIMEYSPFELARATQLLVHQTIPPGIPIDGSAHGLSAGDIDNVMRMYGQTPMATVVTSNPAGLQVIVDGTTITTPQSFTWAPGSTHTLDVPGVQGDGTPIRYMFARWSDNETQAHSVTASTDTTVYSAHFIRQYKVQTGVLPATGGTVTISPASADGYYTDNTLVTVTATPASGFSFTGWNGTGTFIFVSVHGFANNPASFLATIPNLDYVAHFTESPFLTFATDPPNIPITVNGSKGPGPRTFVLNPGASVPVATDATITVGAGSAQYVFVGWSDGGAASHTVTAPASAPFPTITAKYKLQDLVTTGFTGRGSVTVTPSSSTGYYDDGSTIQITAAPASGYQLSGWKGDLSGASTSNTVTVNQQINVQAVFEQPFAITAAGIVNAASFLGGAVSPGEIINVFGLSIGPSNLTLLQLDSSGNVGNSLANTQVLFDGTPSPLVYVTQNSLAAIVPYEVAGKNTTNVQVAFNGQRTNTVSMPVAAVAPGLFTLNSSGIGPGAILNQDGTVNGPGNPAARGSVIVLYVTGEGQTNPPGQDGKIAPGALPLPAPVAPVTVRIGGPLGVGKDAKVIYAGAAPFEVAGVMQIDAIVPADLPSGDVPISFSVGGVSSVDATTVSIR